MPLKTKVEVRFGKWFSVDAWKRTPKDCKEGSAHAPPDASRFQSACKRRLTRSHRDTEERDYWELGPCPRPRKRANHRRLTGVRGMGDCAEEALLRREDSAIAEPEGCSSIREPHLQIIYIFLPITSDKITGFYRIDRIF